MDRLYIDGKEVEMNGEVGIYLTYRSNIMGDIKKILGNNSSTIKIPHTLHNANIIENAQMVTSDTRFPYIKHSADVVRDGIMLIQGATVILLRTTPTEYELSLVWGVSEGLRQMAEEGLSVASLGDYITTQTAEWQDTSSFYGTVICPRAIYGYIYSNGIYRYHPVISLMEIIEAISTKYQTIFSIPDNIGQELRTLVMPILRGKQPVSNVVLSRSAGSTPSMPEIYGMIDWSSIPDGLYNEGDKILKDEVKLIGIDAHVIVYLSRASANDDISPYQDTYLAIMKRTPRENEDGEIEYEDSEVTKIPCSRAEATAVNPYGSVVKITFNYTIQEDFEDFNKDEIFFVQVNNPTNTARLQLKGTAESTMTLTFQKQFTQKGETYYIADNLPDIEIIKWLKGVMQMLGVYAFQRTDGIIAFLDYAKFFNRKAQAQDWSEHLVITATDASEEQEFEADGFFRNNLVIYKGNNPNYNVDSSFNVDSEVLAAEGEYISLPFDAVGKVEGDPVMPSMAIIPLYKMEQEKGDDDVMYNKVKRNDSEEKKLYILRNVETTKEYYLSRKGLDWASLLNNNYQGIIQSVQQAHYITATFYLDAVALQRVDFGYPIYLQQYASYFAIIEIKTKANNLAEVKLLKLV